MCCQKSSINKQLKDVVIYLEAWKLTIFNMVPLDLYNPKT